jgi:glycosyltransferase involved in cell wall biosynthesis
MKILQIHNYYQNPGGEDKVLLEERNLLEKHGHLIDQWTKSNKDLTFFEKLKLLSSTHWSKSAIRECKSLMKGKNYDIIHVHNFFPQFSPSIFKYFRDQGIPSVLTLHNYRIIYPNALLFHKGIDHSTLSGSAYSLIPKKVYRNSYLQTAAVAHMIEFNRHNKTWHKYVDRFICITEFQKQILVRAGLPESKLVVKPNFIETEESGTSINNDRQHPYFVFIGRLSPEKGVKELIEVWTKTKIEAHLYIIGDGELADEVKKNQQQNLEYLGSRPNKETIQILREARALIFPSLWYEGFPITILEAFSMGIPVICTDIGGQGEIVREGSTGLKYMPGDKDQLLNNIIAIQQDDDLRDKLSKNARQDFLNKYTAKINYDLLKDIYQSILR